MAMAKGTVVQRRILIMNDKACVTSRNAERYPAFAICIDEFKLTLENLYDARVS